MQGKRPMHRGVIRLCAFLLSLSILTALAPGSAQAQMCVRYARQLTGFNIQGDAWAWWQNSAGRYQHGMRPVEGSVLVFRRTGRLHYGHVSTVSRVIDRRTILVDHSWLEGYVLHRGMKVVDTSPSNNWSSVKVWHEPSDNLGIRTYPTFGFIYPHGKSVEQPLTVAANDTAERDGDAMAASAPDDDAPAVVRPTARTPVQPTQMATLFLPHRKPVPGGAPPVAAPVAVAATPVEAAVVVAYAPRHKPGLADAPASAPAPSEAGVEYTEVPQVAVPRHKPSGHGGSQQVADARANAELSD